MKSTRLILFLFVNDHSIRTMTTDDFDSETIFAKIRTGRLDLVPYLCVVGAKEEENHSVALRSRKDGELGEMAFDSLIDKLP